MSKIQHSRFKGADWYSEEPEDVIVGGAGGIGSWTSMLLARAGFNPTVYDFDIIEEHNLGGQLYPKLLIGQPKVDALSQIIDSFCNHQITMVNSKYDENSFSHTYVVSAFDNMEARKTMFNNWVEKIVKPWLQNKDSNVPIFIDGRLNAEQMQIFCITPDNIDKYKEHLFDDSEVEDAPCTFKQTSHSAAMIAAHMVGFFTNHITNVKVGSIERKVPFYWEYFIPIDLLTIKDE